MDNVERATTIRVKRSPPKTYNDSTFQGSKLSISDTDSIVPAIYALNTDTRTAQATHNIYAYRIRSGDTYIEHFEDDGEYGAGRRLLQMLQQKDISNTMICCSSWCGENKLGAARFEYIKEACQIVLDM